MKTLEIRLDSFNSLLPDAPYLFSGKDKALLLDALVTLAFGLQQSVKRVEEQLIALVSDDSEYARLSNLANGQPANPFKDMLVKDLASFIPRVTMDIWSVLDISRRLFIIVRKLGLKSMQPSAIAMEENVKGVRDSFQHLDERLTEYYQQHQVGDSIFGDFSWRYRPEREAAEQVYLCKTGMTRGTNDLSKIFIQPSTEPNESSHKTGVYDLSISYIKRVIINKKKKIVQHQSVVVSISELVDIINSMLQGFDMTYRMGFAQHLGIVPPSPSTSVQRLLSQLNRDGIPPRIVQIMGK